MLEPFRGGFLVALVRKRFWVIGPDVRLYLGLPRAKHLGLTTFDDVDIDESSEAEPIAMGDHEHWLAWMPRRDQAFLWADEGVAMSHAMAMKAAGYSEVVVEYAGRGGVIPPEWPT